MTAKNAQLPGEPLSLSAFQLVRRPAAIRRVARTRDHPAAFRARASLA